MLRKMFGLQLAWIIGNTSRTVPGKFTQSLDPSGSMYKSMMASEIIQLNLKKPKFILGKQSLSWIFTVFNLYIF